MFFVIAKILMFLLFVVICIFIAALIIYKDSEGLPHNLLILLKKLPHIAERRCVKIVRLWVESYDRRYPNGKRKENTSLNTIDKSSSRISTLEDKIAHLEQEKTSLKDYIVNLDLQLQTSEAEKKGLIGTNECFLEDKKKSEAEVVYLQNRVKDLENELEKLKNPVTPPKEQNQQSAKVIASIPQILFAEADASECILRKSSIERKQTSLFELHLESDANTCSFVVINNNRIPYIIQNRGQFLNSCEILELNPNATTIHTVVPGKAIKEFDNWKVTQLAKIKIV